MTNKERVDEELGRVFGPRATFDIPDLGDRIQLRLRELIHPLGIHHGVRTFYYDDRLDRLIDEGRVCRVCGVPCN